MDQRTIYQERGRELISYLNIYVNKKGLKIKPIMKTLKYRILNNQPITEKQFMSVIKWVEREPQFSQWDQDSILEYFSPLIVGHWSDSANGQSTLESFF